MFGMIQKISPERAQAKAQAGISRFIKRYGS